MDNWMQILLTVFSSVLASSGLWAYVAKRAEKRRENRDAYRSRVMIASCIWG